MVVVTFRHDKAKAVKDLEVRNIRYDEVILVNRFEDKAVVIAREKIDIFIDDQPEILKHIGQEVSVLLFRNEGNYDFEDRRWMLSDQTGKLM